MASRTTKTAREKHGLDETGFDVTCVIGHVNFSEDGDAPAHVVAFRMIAEHDTQGTFKFPMQNGGTCAVTVEHTDMPEVPSPGPDEPHWER